MPKVVEWSPEYYARLQFMHMHPEECQEMCAWTSIPDPLSVIITSVYFATKNFCRVKAILWGPGNWNIGAIFGTGPSHDVWAIIDKDFKARHPVFGMKETKKFLSSLEKPLWNYVAEINLPSLRYLKHAGATFTQDRVFKGGLWFRKFIFKEESNNVHSRSSSGCGHDAELSRVQEPTGGVRECLCVGQCPDGCQCGQHSGYLK
jgi:hypothetical protein